MWITPLVDLPDELVAAQRERRLVVFVGAGASMAPPSNLPNFAGLTCQIVAESSAPMEDRTDYDLWLGELERRDIDVHRRVQAIIDNDQSKPTALHYAIAGLFESAGDVRVVTTNYDRHLSTVLRESFNGRVEEFRAPALPLGWDFNGLVYLHGSVTQQPDRLVVTDRDFGRAYLVDAWAARFLEAMFHHDYVVLFVGYSHDDTVMNYLSRGLRGPGHRYAFTQDAQATRWQQREIHPIMYPVKGDDHSAIPGALSRWGYLARMGLLDHQERVAELLAGDGPLDPAADSYLRSCIADPQRVGFFCDAATDLRWVSWVEAQPPFQRLFDPFAGLGDGDRRLAYWFGELAVKYPAEMISVLQRQGGRMHRSLSGAIMQQLWKQDRPPAEAINAWTSVILDHNPGLQDDLLNFLLADCRLPDDHHLLLRLFDHLTTPKLDIHPGYGLLDDEGNAFPRVWVDPALRGKEHWLREAWDEQLKPNLDTCADELAVIATRNLLSAWRQLTLLRGGEWDSLSGNRSAIEAHGQDSYPDEVDVLIDVARDALEHLLHRDGKSGQALLTQWSHLPTELFRRLVIHGWTERSDKSSDQKLRWLLANFMIVEGSGGRHEAFRLIREHLATATTKVKKQVLKTALKPPQVDYDTDEEHLAYITYNLVYWLTLSDPDFGEAQTAFEQLQAEHPSFEPRDFPDLDSWSSSGSFGLRTPKTADELIKDPDLAIQMAFLRTYKGDPDAGVFGPDREGLMAAVADAATKDFRWSLRLAAELEALQDEDSDLWEAIFRGWTQTTAADVNWSELVAVADRRTAPERWLRTLAPLLKRAAGDDSRMPVEVLPAAVQLASSLWARGINAQTDAEGWLISGEKVDWYTRAINHWAGDLAAFFVYAISKLWKANRDNWTGIPEEIRQQLAAMIEQDGSPGDAARIVLASFGLFLIGADTQWTVQRLLPILHWSHPERASKAWAGYLRRGQWHDQALIHLMPYFRASFNHLSNELINERDKFCSFLAHIAIQSAIHPLEDGWLNDFLAQADEETAVSWARAVESALERTEDAATTDQWNRWINAYWQRRSDGVPKVLASAEASATTTWLLHAGAHFPAAAAMALNWRGGLAQQDHFLYRLSEHHLLTDYPEMVTKLLAKLLRETQGTFYLCGHLAKIVGQTRNRADEEDLRSVCSEALRLGCTTAGTWLNGNQPAP